MFPIIIKIEVPYNSWIHSLENDVPEGISVDIQLPPIQRKAIGIDDVVLIAITLLAEKTFDIFIPWLYKKVKKYTTEATINGEVIEIKESEIRYILEKEIKKNQ